MKRTTVINLRNSKFLNSVKGNYLVIIFAVVFIIGLTLGTFWVAKNTTIQGIALEEFNVFKTVRQNNKIFKVFLISILDILPFALIVFLCGTSFIGIALTPLVICFFGFKYGIFSGFLYMNYMLKGIAFNSLLLIPTMLFCAIALFVLGRNAFNFSLLLARISMPGGQVVNLYNFFQNYCKKFLLIFVLFIFAAMIDAVMSVSFIKFFDI